MEKQLTLHEYCKHTGLNYQYGIELLARREMLMGVLANNPDSEITKKRVESCRKSLRNPLGIEKKGRFYLLTVNE